MTKKDLKSGYVVVDKNDSIYMVVKDCIERDILLNKNIALQLSSYENDLTHEIDSYTIQKVLQPKYYSSLVNLSTLNFEYITLYDRENSTVNYIYVII